MVVVLTRSVYWGTQLTYDGQMKRIYFRLEIGLKSDRIPEITMNRASLTACSADGNSSLQGESVMNQALTEYRNSLRSRIANKNSDLFENPSPAHARIVIDEFLRAAKESVYIYCGQLSSLIYGELVPSFQNLLERGIKVQVIIEKEKAETEAIAAMLCEKNAIKQSKMASVGDIPHFILVDGKRYRMELNDDKKSALVCAEVAEENGTKATADAMSGFFTRVWKNRSVAYSVGA